MKMHRSIMSNAVRFIAAPQQTIRHHAYALDASVLAFWNACEAALATPLPLVAVFLTGLFAPLPFPLVGDFVPGGRPPVADAASGVPISLNGYLNSSSFLIKCFRLFFVTWCSTIISLPISDMNFLMKRGSHSSDAIPRSLQHRINAFDLQPSVAVGMPSGSKYCCSPRAIETNLPYLLVLCLVTTEVT